MGKVFTFSLGRVFTRLAAPSCNFLVANATHAIAQLDDNADRKLCNANEKCVCSFIIGFKVAEVKSISGAFVFQHWVGMLFCFSVVMGRGHFLEPLWIWKSSWSCLTLPSSIWKIQSNACVLCFPSNLKYWTTNSKLVCLHTNVIAMLNHNCSAAPIMHLFDVNERRKTQAFVFWKMCFVRLCTLLNLNYGLSSVKSDRLNKHKNLFRSVQKLSDGVWMLIKHPWRLLVTLKSASEPFWSLQRPSLEHLGHSWQLLGGFWDPQNRSLALFEGSWMRQSYLGRLFGPQNEHQHPVPRKKNWSKE